MSDKTKIEWTDATWNPIRGCSRVSEGCRNCYAETVAKRFSGPGLPYEGLIAKGGQWNGKIAYIDDLIDQPLRWQKPRRIFVNSMSDLFHENVPIAVIDRVFAVMAIAERHTFQVLTKRPERMRAYLTDDRRSEWAWWATNLWGAKDPDAMFDAIHLGDRALPNVWLGVSVEDQKAADERIPHLLATPAAVRWISAEPLLGPVELKPNWFPQAGGPIYDAAGSLMDSMDDQPGIDWVVVGGESGSHARPMHPDWARSLYHQCMGTGTPFLFKQWGEWCPGESIIQNAPARMGIRQHADLTNGRWWFGETDMDDPEDGWDSEPDLYRVGKKNASRLLDGMQHDGYPEAQP